MGATTVSIEYLDDAGVSGRETLLFPDDTTLAQIEGWLAGGGLTAIDGVTGCQILNVNINLEYDFSGLSLTGAPVTGSRYNVGALFGFRAVDEATQSFFIPAVVQGLVSGADVTNVGAVSDFIAHSQGTGIDVAGTFIKLSNRGGSPLDVFRYVDLKSRKL